MNNYARKINGEWTELVEPFVIGEGKDAIQYPPNWLDSSTQADRNKIGVKPIVEAPLPPANAKFVGTRIVDFNNAPQRENIIEQYSPQEARDIQWQRAKDYREQLIAAGAPTTLGVVDADLTSKANILGVAVAWLICHVLGQPFEQTFTMHDNSQVKLDDENTPLFALSAANYIGKLHDNSQAIRKQLDKALLDGASALSIFQIDVKAGYPSA